MFASRLHIRRHGILDTGSSASETASRLVTALKSLHALQQQIQHHQSSDQSFPTHDGTPLRSTLMTLPAELVMSIMDHLDNWYDIHNLIRAYQGLENSNTTRRFQKLMFRADARKLEERVDFDYGDYPLVHSVPPITAGCWAILMGDVEVALSALEEYRVQGSERRLCGTRFCSEDHLHDARCPKPIVVNLSPPHKPQKNMVKIRDPTPLMLAVLSGNIDMVKTIVERYRRVELDGQSWTLNSYFKGLTDVLHLSKRGTNGIPFVSSLDLAAWLGRKDMVKVLADNGAQVGGWRRPETGPVASLCDWGLDLHIDDEQLLGRVAVLEFLLDKEYNFDSEKVLDFDCPPPARRVHQGPRRRPRTLSIHAPLAYNLGHETAIPRPCPIADSPWGQMRTLGGSTQGNLPEEDHLQPEL